MRRLSLSVLFIISLFFTSSAFAGGGGPNYLSATPIKCATNADCLKLKYTNKCTVTTRCISHRCHLYLNMCEDFDPNTIDSCDAISGNCLNVHDPAPPECINNSECNDNNPCTDDICTFDLPGSGSGSGGGGPWYTIIHPQCIHVDRTGTCYTEKMPFGVCQEGQCVPAECNPSSYCEDGNPCTEDWCSPLTNTCMHQAYDNFTPCGDNHYCFGGECLSQSLTCGDVDSYWCYNDYDCDYGDACLNGYCFEASTAVSLFNSNNGYSTCSGAYDCGLFVNFTSKNIIQINIDKYPFFAVTFAAPYYSLMTAGDYFPVWTMGNTSIGNPSMQIFSEYITGSVPTHECLLDAPAYFIVLDIDMNMQKPYLSSLAIDFSATCANGVIYKGSIRYNSAVPLTDIFMIY